MEIVQNDYAETPYGAIALQMAKALGEGKFDGAHNLLTPDLQQTHSPSKLKSLYQETIGYDDTCVLAEIEVMEILEDWIGKQPQDLGWAYVSMDMTEYGEVIAVVVTKDLLIREIEWGRP